MGELKPSNDSALRRAWPYVRGYGMAAIIGFAPLAKLAKLAHAPLAPSQTQAIIGLIGALVFLALAEGILERLGLVDKAPRDTPLDDEEGLPPPRPRLPPIAEAAAFDPVAEPPAPADETTLTPLGGGALPASFERDGRRMLWRVDKTPAA